MLPPIPEHIDSAMRRALDLARRGWGRVEPNPMVGCVLLRDGSVIGEGWHGRFGGPHAEVEALGDARRRGEEVRGATAVVTLEPCCHHGKTPPCAEALIESGIGRVYVALVDPDPRVAGGGITMLREGGVEVEVFHVEHTLAKAAGELNEAFIKRVTTGLPWVIAKWAQTLDGRIATRTGDSKWISSPASRERVHRLRGACDAVMVGAGTAVADDPLLTARPADPGDVKRVARRVVVDPRGRWARGVGKVGGVLEGEGPAMLRVDAERGGVWPGVTIAVGEDVQNVLRQELRRRGVDMYALRQPAGSASVEAAEGGGGGGMFDLRPLLAHLAGEHAATRVVVEGGAGLVGSLLAQGLVDEVQAFIAPRLMGDPAGLAPLDVFHVEHIADTPELELVGCEVVEGGGGDVWVRYRVGQTGIPKCEVRSANSEVRSAKCEWQA